MTKDRLRSLSYSALSQIAEQNNINCGPNLDKESLISEIYDAFEEDRLDRNITNSITIQVESRKFFVSQDEELYAEFSGPSVIPDRYHDTRLVLMLRDPSWVYCYWDIEDSIRSQFTEMSEFGGFILRVTELAEPKWGKDSSIDCFNIPIRFEDLCRYINLPTEAACYGAEIYAKMGENVVLVTRSNIVESSRSYQATSQNGEHDARRDKLIELSGFSTDIGTFPGTDFPDSDIPQRIITHVNGSLHE